MSGVDAYRFTNYLNCPLARRFLVTLLQYDQAKEQYQFKLEVEMTNEPKDQTV